jgi:transcriptional regulator with PAS, ATPase and Fis domain
MSLSNSFQKSFASISPGEKQFSFELASIFTLHLIIDDTIDLIFLILCNTTYGESAAMISIFRWIVRVSALSDLPILLLGETGTGKQVHAHAIHRLDPKWRGGPFVAVNCGAISPGLAESEFFGHRRGAFTGADRERLGLVRSAQGGVLFLDEIGELDDTLQAKRLQ